MKFIVQTDRWLEVIWPTRSSNSVFFPGPRANAKLVHKFPAPQHASRASLQTSISKYTPKHSYWTVIKILSNASPRLSNSKQEPPPNISANIRLISSATNSNSSLPNISKRSTLTPAYRYKGRAGITRKPSQPHILSPPSHVTSAVYTKSSSSPPPTSTSSRRPLICPWWMRTSQILVSVSSPNYRKIPDEHGKTDQLLGDWK